MEMIKQSKIFAAFFCALLLALGTLDLQAQSSIVLNLEPAITNIDGFNYAHFGGRAGFSFQPQFNDQWDFSGGTGYFTVGNRVTQTTLGNGHDQTDLAVRTRLHFIDLEAELGFTIGGKIRLSAGPYLAYLLYAGQQHRLVFTDNGEQAETSYTENQTGLFRQFDFGIRPSVTYNLSDALSLGLTYNQGLQQLSVLDGLFEIDQRSRAFMLSVDWTFASIGK